jgi:hypothetical protein
MRADGVILWQCNDCRKWLAASAFYVRRAAPEGLQPKCKACAKRIMAARTARLRDERNGEKAVLA